MKKVRHEEGPMETPQIIPDATILQQKSAMCNRVIMKKRNPDCHKDKGLKPALWLCRKVTSQRGLSFLMPPGLPPQRHKSGIGRTNHGADHLLTALPHMNIQRNLLAQECRGQLGTYLLPTHRQTQHLSASRACAHVKFEQLPQ